MGKQITLNLPEEFLKLCERDKVDPEEVLKAFISDVAGIINWHHPDPSQGRMPRPDDGYQSGGSDERRFAYQYYQRRGFNSDY